MTNIHEQSCHGIHCDSCLSSSLTRSDWLINKNGNLTQKTSNYDDGYIFPVISTPENGRVGKMSQL